MIFTLLFGSYSFPNQSFEILDLNLEKNVQSDQIPRKDGVILQADYLGMRKIRIRGIIHNASSEDSNTQLMAMQAALLAGEGNFQHRSDRYIKCYTKNIRPDFEEGTDKAVINIDLEFNAEDPFFYSAGASYSNIQTPVKGTTLLFNIWSGGNVAAKPKFSTCATGGTINDDMLVQNLTNGQSMRFRGIIPNGATLEVNAENLTVLNNQVDGITNFEGDFISLVAGTNSFQFVGATCRFTTEHKYRWY